ncbi:NAD(P)/FAD-dependent oxidoreductase [uncultured Shewanella sp.]|uniref:NAD(P)/FAD-dependent oxidoreductase n=1 Tax=uncultured Shewanella sp. TaxID=173975 RepID=UPI0026320869|nr:FAD-dependent oxidoreductase [uncultured Shewanella sp.]
MKKQTDVLIIGGGFAGVAAAQKLSQHGMNVILLDRKNYFEVTFAVLRNVTAPKTMGNTPRKYYRDFIHGTFIQACVTSMNEKEAELDNGECIGFQYAIIASGSRYPTLPLAKSHVALDYHARSQELMQSHAQLVAAQSVLVMGGGSVGVEFAGEIASSFPDKAITLAHSSESLLDNMKPKAQRKAHGQLMAKGVTVKLNRKFIQEGEAYRCVKSNESLKVDIAYQCVGMLPNTEFLKAELPDILDNTGLVKVDEYMRVVGFAHLYALGDCAALDSHKHGYIASVQGARLAEQIVKSLQGKKISPYKTPPFAIITPTGTDSGVAQMPFGVTTANFFVNMKQKDMGIRNMYKLYGAVPDKRV